MWHQKTQVKMCQYIWNDDFFKRKISWPQTRVKHICSWEYLTCLLSLAWMVKCKSWDFGIVLLQLSCNRNKSIKQINLIKNNFFHWPDSEIILFAYTLVSHNTTCCTVWCVSCYRFQVLKAVCISDTWFIEWSNFPSYVLSIVHCSAACKHLAEYDLWEGWRKDLDCTAWMWILELQ